MTNFICGFHLQRIAFAIIFFLAASPSFAADMIQVLPGTEVRLQLSEALSSHVLRKGHNFKLSVEKDVRVRGQVVIPKGTEANGVVVRTAPSQWAGKPGELHVRIEYLLLNGRRIALFAGAGGSGKSSDGAAVVLTALFGPVGVFKRGKEVIYPAGASFLSYIDQGFEVPVVNTTTATVSTVINAGNAELLLEKPVTTDNAVRIENAQQNDNK
jgi:hypothetical protein